MWKNLRSMHRKQIAQAKYQKAHPEAEEEVSPAPADVVQQQKEEEGENMKHFATYCKECHQIVSSGETNKRFYGKALKTHLKQHHMNLYKNQKKFKKLTI